MTPLNIQVLKELLPLAVVAALSLPASGQTVYTQNLTLQTGDSPTLKFTVIGSEDHSSSFVANEGSFSFNSTSNGTTITPFRIAAGAPDNSLVIATQAPGGNHNGRVGIGTDAPFAQLDVFAPAEAGPETIARFRIADGGAAKLDFANASSTDGAFVPLVRGKSETINAALVMAALINVDTGTSPAIVHNSARSTGGAIVNKPLIVYRNNNVAVAAIAADGTVTATSFNPSSSRAIKDQIVELDSEKALDALRKLTPVRYCYKADAAGRRRLGFIAEDVPEIVASADRKSVPIMDVVALLTRVVKDQQSLSDEEWNCIREQQKLIDDRDNFLNRQNQFIRQQQRSLEEYQSAGARQQKSIDELSKRLADLQRRMQK